MKQLNKEKLNLMFALLKELESTSCNVRETFGSEDFLDKEISIMWQLIECELEIEPCDESNNILSSFGCGEISQMKTIGKLLKLN